MSYRVAEFVVDSLSLHGVDRVYHVPGESFLPVLDAFHGRPDIDLVTCRHEGSAGLAAVADAKLTGIPGVLFVSRGPGAFNAAIALHVAEQEAIPLVMFIGQVDTTNLGRGAVQEIESAKAFAGTIKWSARIDRPEQAGEILARAFSVASNGTPGPVIVELPEDVLSLAADKSRVRAFGNVWPECTNDTALECANLINSAQRPLLLIGGECRTEQFRTDLREFSERWSLPVVATNKCQDQFPNDHPNWVGQLGFFPSPSHVALFSEVDLFIVVGSRLGDVSSLGYQFPKPDGSQWLIHVYPDGNQVGRFFDPDRAVISSAHSFVRAMLRHHPDAPARAPWRKTIQVAKDAGGLWNSSQLPAADVFGHAVTALASHLSPDAVVTTDSGNFAGWVHRVFKMTPHNRLLGSACGAMGSGVPSGLSAALRYPGRQVLAFCGDGGFLMNGNELATAVARNLDLKIIVSNNGSYGTIRTHQQRNFPSRVSGTDLSNPDFVQLAQAYGAQGFLIERADEAEAIVRMAMQACGPVLIEVRSDVEQGLEKSVAAMRSALPA